MIDMNLVIANNINAFLEQNHQKQADLANHLHVSRQIVNKMQNGTRTINAAELLQIAQFCGTNMETLTTVPDNYEENDVFHVFMGQAKTEEARQSIRDINTLIELILFHAKIRENGMAMREEWTDF